MGRGGVAKAAPPLFFFVAIRANFSSSEIRRQLYWSGDSATRCSRQSRRARIQAAEELAGLPSPAVPVADDSGGTQRVRCVRDGQERADDAYVGGGVGHRDVLPDA